MDDEAFFADLENSISAGQVQIMIVWNPDEESMLVDQVNGEPLADVALVGVLELAKMYVSSLFMRAFIQESSEEEEEEDEEW